MRRGEAEEHAGQDANPGAEGEHRRIRTHINRDRLPASRHQQQQSAAAPLGKEHAQRTANRGEKNALGEELANEPSARGTCREPDAHLLLAGRRASQQQHRHIGAGDQQDQADGRHQNQQRLRKPLAQQMKASVGGNELQVGEVLRLGQRVQPGADLVMEENLHFGARLFLGVARLQTPHDHEPPPAPVSEHRQAWRGLNAVRAQSRLIAHRDPDARSKLRIHTEELGRGHADNGGRRSVERDRPADDGRVPAELVGPVRVTDHRDVRGARFQIIVDKDTPEDR